MSQRFNPTRKQVVSFLVSKGYQSARWSGSHEIFVGMINGQRRIVIVCLAKNGRAYLPKTLRHMIMNSGIPKEEWIQEIQN